jgi:cbb3-type cytochrome oxidase subunit 3
MKVVERGRIIVARIGEGAVVPLALTPFCMVLGIAPWIYVGLFVSALIFGYFRIHVSGLAIGFGLSAALFSCVTVVFEVFSPRYEMNGSLLVATFLIAGSAFAFGTRQFNLQPHKNGDVLVWGSFSILFSWMTWSVHSWTPVGALNILMTTDDRHSTWLAGLAHSVQEGGVVLSDVTNGNGGPSSNVVLVAGRVLLNWLLQTSELVRTDNALALLQISIVGVLLICGTWVLIAGVMTKTKPVLVRCTYSLSIALLTYCLAIGFVRVGNFAALCGTLFISLAVLAHLTLNASSVKTRYVQSASVLILLVAAGMAWLPLILIAILYGYFSAAKKLSDRGKLWSVDGEAKVVNTTLFTVAFVVTVGLFLSQSSVLENISAVSLRIQNGTLPGGSTAIHPFLLVLSFACVIWFALREEKHEINQDRIILISALIIPLAGLLLRSYFKSPFVPVVQDWTLVYVCAAIFIPFSFLILISGMEKNFTNKKSEILLGPAFVILLFTLLTPTSTNMNWISNLSNVEPGWAKTVVDELARSPEKAVACLNTIKGDVAGDKDAYECTKMAFALGGFDSDAHKIWESSTGCLLQPINAVGQFSSFFQSSLTVLLTDAFRTSSFAGCQSVVDGFQNGWLSDLDWRNMRTMSQSGIPVTVSPTSPGQ